MDPQDYLIAKKVEIAPMNTRRTDDINLASWDQLPKPHKPLPGQMHLLNEDDEETRVAFAFDELFDTGRDLPGAGEEEQRIIWDVEV